MQKRFNNTFIAASTSTESNPSTEPPNSMVSLARDGGWCSGIWIATSMSRPAPTKKSIFSDRSLPGWS